ncbi:DUF2635 domain-containing protein [Paludibacterium yongneupense]|uniref:DUF2635 domain-containing protein n=1 Tax=Paludibacterium yongneupense TaxID=400061 RepID=UPI0004284CAA|nr:DUF2635 domain-containing protein [Paludibacterium yongneupense]
MKVKAAPGVRVPKQGAPRKYITDDAEVVVDATPYYLRRLRDGDLIEVEDGASTVETPVEASTPTPTADTASVESKTPLAAATSAQA